MSTEIKKKNNLRETQSNIQGHKTTTKKRKTTTKRQQYYKETEDNHRDAKRLQRCTKQPPTATTN